MMSRFSSVCRLRVAVLIAVAMAGDGVLKTVDDAVVGMCCGEGRIVRGGKDWTKRPDECNIWKEAGIGTKT